MPRLNILTLFKPFGKRFQKHQPHVEVKNKSYRSGQKYKLTERTLLKDKLRHTENLSKNHCALCNPKLDVVRSDPPTEAGKKIDRESVEAKKGTH